MARIHWLVIVMSLLVSNTYANGDAEAGATKAQVCRACHGVDGNSVVPTFPKLAGQHSTYLKKQLSDFESGGRVNPIMQPMVSSLSAKDMDDLAAYFASLAAAPGSETPPEYIATGQRLFLSGDPGRGIPACSSCHGLRGEGNLQDTIPKLSGQHYQYIAIQLNAFKNETRANDAGALMRNATASLTAEEITALALYLEGGVIVEETNADLDKQKLVAILLGQSNTNFLVEPDDPVEDSDANGLEVMTEFRLRNQGWGDSVAEVTMVTTESNGQENERGVRILMLETVDEGDKVLFVTDSPSVVAGDSFLGHTFKSEADQFWTYSIGQRRVRRLTSGQTALFQSEFMFEDVTSFEIEKYDYDLLRSDNFQENDVWVVSLTPKSDVSGYAKIIMWVDKSEYRARQIQYFDTDDQLFKRLVAEDFRQYQGTYWRPQLVEMRNLQTGAYTRLDMDNITFNTGLDDSDFTPTSLRRGK